MNFTLNGRTVSFEGDEDTPLLWIIRDEFGLNGTKFGCGMSLCGACTVHVDDVAVRSCSYPASLLSEKSVVTIEGAETREALAVKQAWIEQDVPQCGYCQTGMIMAVTAFLKDAPNPSDEQINDNITNLCRCSTYHRIRAAVHQAAEILRS